MSCLKSAPKLSIADNQTVTIEREAPQDCDGVEALTWRVFGPGMVVRAAFALREGVNHEFVLARVAKNAAGEIVGTVRFTQVMWGRTPVWMLGPLAVAQEVKGLGIGSALMRASMKACEDRAQEAGIHHVILVGDLAYYEPFGFQRVPPGTADLPRSADPHRILACPLPSAEGPLPQGPVERFTNQA